MSKKDFNAFRKVVGKENIFDIDDTRADAHRNRFATLANAPQEVIGVVLPGKVEELQECVRVAAKRNLGIWSAANAAGNGMLPGPLDKPVVVLDLQRMNRIIEVNTNGAYALIEPGVSYKQLNQYLAEKGISIWLDCDRNGENSIAGSILSRQFGYTPYGDHLMMQCGMEVVLSDGGLLRTGTGAMPNDKTWQLFKRNLGPYIDGLFTDSTNGIVSKIGLWVMPAPPVYKPFMASLSKHEDLAALVEMLRPMKMSMAVPGTVVISHANFDAAPYSRSADYKKGEQVDVEQVTKAHDLGVWNIYSAFYGTDRTVGISWGGFEPALKSVGDVRIYQQDERGDDPVWQGREQLMRGVPADTDIDLSGWGGTSYLEITAASPLEGGYAMQMHDIARSVLNESGREYLGEYVLAGRTMFKRVYLPYEADDASSVSSARSVALELAEKFTQQGFGIVNESLALKTPLKEQFGTSKLNVLAQRVNERMDPEGLFTA